MIYLVYFAVHLLCFARFSSSECCFPNKLSETARICPDGNVVESFYCGKGSCNFFGCDCDGGCKAPNTSWYPGDIIGCVRYKTFLSIQYYHVFVLGFNNSIYDVQPDRIRKTRLQVELDEGESCTTMTKVYRDYGVKEGLIDTPGFRSESELGDLFDKLDKRVNSYWDYHVFYRNCEHFVTEVLFGGKRFSLQTPLKKKGK